MDSEFRIFGHKSGFSFIFVLLLVFDRTQIQQTSNSFELDVVSMFEPIQRLFQFKHVQKSMKSVIFRFNPTLIEYDNKRGATFTSQEVSEMISFDNTHLKNAIRNFKGTL